MFSWIFLDQKQSMFVLWEMNRLSDQYYHPRVCCGLVIMLMVFYNSWPRKLLWVRFTQHLTLHKKIIMIFVKFVPLLIFTLYHFFTLLHVAVGLLAILGNNMRITKAFDVEQLRISNVLLTTEVRKVYETFTSEFFLHSPCLTPETAIEKAYELLNDRNLIQSLLVSLLLALLHTCMH